jgi:hypothetical protein
MLVRVAWHPPMAAWAPHSYSWQAVSPLPMTLMSPLPMTAAVSPSPMVAAMSPHHNTAVGGGRHPTLTLLPHPPADSPHANSITILPSYLTYSWLTPCCLTPLHAAVGRGWEWQAEVPINHTLSKSSIGTYYWPLYPFIGSTGLHEVPCQPGPPPA